MTAFVSVIPQCDGWAGACHRGSVYRQVEREAWPPVLASPLSRSAGVLGFSLLSHLDTQASWVAVPKPTTGPLPGTATSCVSSSLFIMMDVNTSDTAIGGLPGLQIFTFSVASPHPAPVTFPQEFCFPSRFSLILPQKNLGLGAPTVD